MSQHDRAEVASIPVSDEMASRRSPRTSEADGIGAAGHVLTLVEQDREALKRLCDVGRMIRRSDGNYGTPSERMITRAVAIRLKKRGLATPGFDKDMFPTIRGKQLNAEATNAAR